MEDYYNGFRDGRSVIDNICIENNKRETLGV